MTEAFVYWLRAKTGEVIYVGVTNNLTRRLRQHAEKAWGKQVASHTAIGPLDRADAELVERDEIRRLTPRHNKMHSGRPYRTATKRTPPKVRRFPHGCVICGATAKEIGLDNLDAHLAAEIASGQRKPSGRAA